MELPSLLEVLSKSVLRLKSSLGENDSKLWNEASTKFQDALNKAIECHQKITTATQLLCLEELKQKDASQTWLSKTKNIHDGVAAIQAVFERVSVSLGLLLEGTLFPLHLFFRVYDD